MDKRQFFKKLAFIGASVTVAVGFASWINTRKANSTAVATSSVSTLNKKTGKNETVTTDTASLNMQVAAADSNSTASRSTDPASRKAQTLTHAQPSTQEKKPMIKKLELSNEAWKKRLTKDQYFILRKEGTERPFTSELNQEKRKGVFHCAGCDLDLFTSAAKYDSGTGWPSFFTHIEGHLAMKEDHKLFAKRTEYHCARCGGHHGHVFDDGPPPTGQRWCNNGIALKFIPAST